MEVTAKLKHLRMSARKVRPILNLIKGMNAQDAMKELSFMSKRASGPVLKLLKSALSNAEHNYSMNRQKLKIQIAKADQGRTVKKFTPKAFGKAAPIRKRSSHITMVLTDK